MIKTTADRILERLRTDVQLTREEEDALLRDWHYLTTSADVTLARHKWRIEQLRKELDNVSD